MAADASTTERPALSPRASLALLTLQLRAAQHEASAAEAEVSGWDLDASVAHLRARLAPRVESRRVELDEEMKRERAAAAEAVSAARVQAAAIVAEAQAEVEARAAEAERERRLAAEREAQAAELALLATAAEHEASDGSEHEEDCASKAVDEVAVTASAAVVDVAIDDDRNEQSAVTGELPVVEPLTEVEPTEATSAPAVDGSADASTAETVARLTALRSLVDELLRAAAPAPEVTPAASTAPVESASIKVVIDADSFSQAFSSAISSLLDERLALHRAQQEAWMTAPWRVVPVAAPPPKKSFWANAWHADVLLSVMAMAIILVILIAWST